MNIRLDPRTKLYMILIVSAVVMMSATTPLLWAVRIIITLVPIILAGVIADLIARSGGYKSFKKTVISNGIFSLWICANYFPVVITADSYRKDLILILNKMMTK